MEDLSFEQMLQLATCLSQDKVNTKFRRKTQR